jgi:predicted dehydrogenase
MQEVGFAIIGCGNIGPVHAMAIGEAKSAKLVAVSDLNEAVGRKLADAHHVDLYSDYKEMIKRDDVQAVCLCVPSGLRAEIAEVCAAAGKHILSEKPLEVNADRIDRVITAADSHGVKLGCIFQSRFSDGAQLIRKAVDEGRFGKLILGDAYIKWYRSQEYYNSGAWRGTRKLDGGGALMNQGIHQIDLLQWFMGPVKAVTAKTALLAHEGLEVEDLACAIIEFESGAMGVVEGSTAIWPGHPERVEIHGTTGSVALESGEIRNWQFQEARPGDDEILAALGKETALGSGAGDPIANLKHEGHRRQIQDFAAAILENRAPRIEGREGRRAVALIEAIYRSAASGKAEPVQ